MARFYGSIDGQNSRGNYGETTRMIPRGGSGHIRGWNIGAEVTVGTVDDTDYVEVRLTSGSNGGPSIYLGRFTENDFKAILNGDLDIHVSYRRSGE